MSGNPVTAGGALPAPDPGQYVWRLIRSGPGEAAWNMAVDDVLLENTRDERVNTLRFYSWDPPAVSLGYAQKPDRHIRLDRCRSGGIPVVRRLTGGKAVFHHSEITYSITGPRSLPPFHTDLMDSYRWIALAFLAGFRRLNLRAEMAPREERGEKGGVTSCFAAPSAYEITVGGRKILGSAQKRVGWGVLQHGSLLLDYDHGAWCRLMCRPGEDAKRITSLRMEMGVIPDIPAVMDAIVAGFVDAHGIRFTESELRDDERERAYDRMAARYADLSLQLDRSLQCG